MSPSLAKAGLLSGVSAVIAVYSFYRSGHYHHYKGDSFDSGTVIQIAKADGGVINKLSITSRDGRLFDSFVRGTYRVGQHIDFYGPVNNDGIVVCADQDDPVWMGLSFAAMSAGFGAWFFIGRKRHLAQANVVGAASDGPPN